VRFSSDKSHSFHRAQSLLNGPVVAGTEGDGGEKSETIFEDKHRELRRERRGRDVAPAVEIRR
jgi:hypothetical protein